jgi:hypothetical protein
VVFAALQKKTQIANTALFPFHSTNLADMGKEKVHISLVVIGHVDAGKWTTT